MAEMGCSVSLSIAKIIITAATAPASTDANIYNAKVGEWPYAGEPEPKQ